MGRLDLLHNQQVLVELDLVLVLVLAVVLVVVSDIVVQQDWTQLSRPRIVESFLRVLYHSIYDGYPLKVNGLVYGTPTG
jgi:hypothetical protein